MLSLALRDRAGAGVDQCDVFYSGRREEPREPVTPPSGEIEDSGSLECVKKYLLTLARK